MYGIKSNGNAYRVLVVDDSTFIAKQLSYILSSEGFEVIGIAQNGAVGLDMYIAQNGEIDLVTMDITMPKMDGITALERIIAFNKEAKVIMISAVGKEDLVKKSIIAGAKGFIVKPLERKKVLERVAAVLE